MFVKQLSILSILLCVFVYNPFISKPAGAIENSIECRKPGKVERSTLPKNLRIIEAPKHKDIGYWLINPRNNSRMLIPGTKFQGALLLSKADQMLFLREIAHNKIEWVAMNIDGSDAQITRQDSQWPLTKIISDDHLLLFENETVKSGFIGSSAYKVFNLQNNTFSLSQPFKLVDFVPNDPVSSPTIPGDIEFNADATRIAYAAYQKNEDGSLAYGEPRLIRIQDVRSGEYIDIRPVNWESAPQFFYWSNTINLLTTEIGSFGKYLEIFNTDNGNLLSQINPPNTDQELTAFSLAWSPNRQRIAIEWNIHYEITVADAQRPYESILAIYDVGTSQKLESCFLLPGGAYDVNHDRTSRTYQWSFDGNLIWWLACPSIGSSCTDQFNLMLVDLNTDQYGSLLENTNIFTHIGFLNSSNK